MKGKILMISIVLLAFFQASCDYKYTFNMNIFYTNEIPEAFKNWSYYLGTLGLLDFEVSKNNHVILLTNYNGLLKLQILDENGRKLKEVLIENSEASSHQKIAKISDNQFLVVFVSYETMYFNVFSESGELINKNQIEMNSFQDNLYEISQIYYDEHNKKIFVVIGYNYDMDTAKSVIYELTAELNMIPIKTLVNILGAKIIHNPFKGGYVAIGYIYSDSENNNSDIYLATLDPNFSQTWEKVFGGSGWDTPSSIVVVNNGFVVGVKEHSNDGFFEGLPSWQGYILVLDENGKNPKVKVLPMKHSLSYVTVDFLQISDESLYLVVGLNMNLGDNAVIYLLSKNLDKIFFGKHCEYQKVLLNKNALYIVIYDRIDKYTLPEMEGN